VLRSISPGQQKGSKRPKLPTKDLQGSLGREFFVIVEGSAEVARGGTRIATRGAGEFVGEIALLTTTKRTATVTATTPLRCFVMTQGEIAACSKRTRASSAKSWRS